MLRTATSLCVRHNRRRQSERIDIDFTRYLRTFPLAASSVRLGRPRSHEGGSTASRPELGAYGPSASHRRHATNGEPATPAFIDVGRACTPRLADWQALTPRAAPARSLPARPGTHQQQRRQRRDAVRDVAPAITSPPRRGADSSRGSALGDALVVFSCSRSMLFSRSRCRVAYRHHGLCVVDALSDCVAW